MFSLKGKNKRKFLLLVFVLLVFAFIAFFVSRESRISLEKTDSQKKTESSLESENGRCTLYANEEYGFSFCYPLSASLPEEREVTPPQQWLYEVKVKDVEREYEFNLYDQMLPTPLESFVRTYFASVDSGPVDVFEKEINGRKTVGFYIIKEGSSPIVSLFLSFLKGTKVMVVNTPEVSLSQKDSLLEDNYFKTITENFEWN